MTNAFLSFRMANRFLAALLIVTGLAGCHKSTLNFPQDAPYDQVSRNDPKVVKMLEAAKAVDRTRLGFRAIPNPLSRSVQVRLQGRTEHSDVTLHLAFDQGFNSLHFLASPGGYQWIGEQEIYPAPGEEGSYEHPPRELIMITFQGEQKDIASGKKALVIYTGDDARLTGRNLTAEEIQPILREWRKKR